MWNAVIIKNDPTKEEGYERNPSRIYINDLSLIIDLAGTLMNKADPESDDETPYDEFMDHAEQEVIEG